MVSCAKDQAELVEPTRPVLLIVHVVRDLHPTTIADLPPDVTSITTAAELMEPFSLP